MSRDFILFSLLNPLFLKQPPRDARGKALTMRYTVSNWCGDETQFDDEASTVRTGAVHAVTSKGQSK